MNEQDDKKLLAQLFAAWIVVAFASLCIYSKQTNIPIGEAFNQVTHEVTAKVFPQHHVSERNDDRGKQRSRDAALFTFWRRFRGL